MPVGTVSLTPVRYDLETLPPDGFVELKRMPYGQKLTRAENAMNASMKGSREQMNEAEEVEMMMNLLQRRVAEIEFRECIVDHNITDPDGNKLDFRIPQTLDHLDPRVGEEISTYIDAMNNYQAEATKPGNSEIGSKEQSSSDTDPIPMSTSS